MPDRQDDPAAAHGFGAREDRFGGNARESFVDHVLVGVAAPKRPRIPCARVAVGGLHEDERTRGAIAVGWSQKERAVEKALGPGVAERDGVRRWSGEFR